MCCIHDIVILDLKLESQHKGILPRTSSLPAPAFSCSRGLRLRLEVVFLVTLVGLAVLELLFEDLQVGKIVLLGDGGWRVDQAVWGLCVRVLCGVYM